MVQFMFFCDMRDWQFMTAKTLPVGYGVFFDDVCLIPAAGFNNRKRLMLW